MADERPKNPKGTTTRGAFVYPKLNAPDTKFKDEGEYSVKVLFPSREDATAVIDGEKVNLCDYADEQAAESLEKVRDKEKTAAKKKKWETKYLPYIEVEDEEGEPTGEVEVKFGMKASGVSKKTGKEWKRSPAIFDAKGKPMKKAPSIWGGTEGKISFEVRQYAHTTQSGASVSFALEAVQVIKLVSGSNRSAEDYGFGVEDGGYEYDESDIEDETGNESADDNGADGDDDEADF